MWYKDGETAGGVVEMMVAHIECDMEQFPVQQDSVQILDSGAVETMLNRVDVFTCDKKGPIELSIFFSARL